MNLSIEAQAFFLNTVYDLPSGCWVWIKKPNKSTGYAEYSQGRGNKKLAHRVSYELCKGPIPEGMQIDHICRVRHCVNPDHLRCVTPKENVLCGEGHAAKNAVKTHCKYGHEFTPENTRYAVRFDNRICIECTRIDNRRRKNKKYVGRGASL